MAASDDAQQRPTAEASRERIVNAGKSWHKVLAVSILASMEEVKKAFRQLALIHHPDKAGGDGDTFKIIQESYIVGLRKCKKQPSLKPSYSTKTKETKAPSAPKGKSKAKSKSKATASDENLDNGNGQDSRPQKRARPKPWAVPEGATAAKIAKAVDKYEECEQWEDKTLPDQIQAVTPAEFATYLRAASCIAVDVREENAQSGVEVQEAVHLSYSHVIFSAHEVAPTIVRLREGGKRVVCFSEQPGLMGTCGMVGAILLDVFGFQENLVCRLEGGCVAWEEYLDANPSVARTVETLVMRMQRRKRSSAKLVAAQNAMADSFGLEPVGAPIVTEEIAKDDGASIQTDPVADTIGVVEHVEMSAPAADSSITVEESVCPASATSGAADVADGQTDAGPGNLSVASAEGNLCSPQIREDASVAVETECDAAGEAHVEGVVEDTSNQSQTNATHVRVTCTDNAASGEHCGMDMPTAANPNTRQEACIAADIPMNAAKEVLLHAGTPPIGNPQHEPAPMTA